MNLIRRGADGSLRMSTDTWVLDQADDHRVVFRGRPKGPPHEGESADDQLLELPLADVDRVTWDRLPRQQRRSQLRFHLKSGDLLTFSGSLAEPGSG
jgi:hypothetical protein